VHALATLIGIEAVLVAVAYTLASGSWERTCLYLLGGTAPLEVYRTTVGNVNLSLFRMSIAISLAAVIVLRVRERRLADRAPRHAPGSVSRIEAAYILLAGTIAASFVVHGEALFLGKRLIVIVVAGIVVIAVSAELARRTPIRVLAIAVVAGAVLPILASFWQVLGPRIGSDGTLPFLADLPVGEGLDRARADTATFDTTQSVAVRLKGTFVDPNHFGSYLVFILVLAVGLTVESALTGRRTRAASCGGLACAAAAALVATYSRSAWGATAIAAALMIVLAASTLRTRTTARQRLAAVALAIAFLAIVALPLASTVGPRLTPGSALNEPSNKLHTANGEAGLRQFREHPLLGIGVGELGVLLGQQPRPSGADSTYLTVAAELGAVGLLALFLTAGSVLEALAGAYRQVRARPAALLPAALIAAYVGFVAENVFYDQLWWRDFHFVLLGLIAAVSARYAALDGVRARS
jgi:hypothetical protein